MSKPTSSTPSAALTLTMILPGYSAEAPALDPTTVVTDSITEAETTSRWTVMINPPKRWLLFHSRSSCDTIMIRESYKKGDPKGALISALSNNLLRKHGDNVKFSPETGMVDVDTYRDTQLADEDVRFGEISDARPMGSRTIGGKHVTGSTCILTTNKEEVHVCQLWHVRHPEGVWNFHICSVPGETDIAPELPTALETTRRVDTPPTFSCSKTEDSNYPY